MHRIKDMAQGRVGVERKETIDDDVVQKRIVHIHFFLADGGVKALD